VGIGKIWYWIWVIGAHQKRPSAHECAVGPPQLPGVPLDTPPPHIPSDPVDDPALPPGARGPLFIFRKINLYGKTKKSTHGHTNEKPICTEKSFASSEISHFARHPPTHPPATAKIQCTPQRRTARTGECTSVQACANAPPQRAAVSLPCSCPYKSRPTLDLAHTKTGLPCSCRGLGRETTHRLHGIFGFRSCLVGFGWESRPTLQLPHTKSRLPCTSPV
jgi:hypothetical protein